MPPVDNSRDHHVKAANVPTKYNFPPFEDLRTAIFRSITSLEQCALFANTDPFLFGPSSLPYPINRTSPEEESHE